MIVMAVGLAKGCELHVQARGTCKRMELSNVARVPKLGQRLCERLGFLHQALRYRSKENYRNYVPVLWARRNKGNRNMLARCSLTVCRVSPQ